MYEKRGFSSAAHLFENSQYSTFNAYPCTISNHTNLNSARKTLCKSPVLFINFE